MGDNAPGGDGFDPPFLPVSAASLPTFDDIPEALRQVLVVDDNAVFRSFLRGLLQGHGFTVYEAGNGADGLALAVEKQPWLILTDLRMPGDDGFELVRSVRAHRLIRRTPILFLSGWDDYTARRQGLELGADDFVSKETPARELLMRIQLTLERYVSLGRRGANGPAMEGRIEVMGAPGVLQACHLTRLTGLLIAEADGRQVTIRFRDGEIVGASGGGHYAADAVYAFLAWERGRFEFIPGDPGAERRLAPSFSELILEGCRRLDEAARAVRERGAEPAS